MNPHFALTVTIIFIIAIFKIDFKKEVKHSYALWIPLLWMMRSVSKPFSFWIDPTTSVLTPDMDLVEGDPIDRTIFIVLIILSLIVLSRRKIKWNTIFRNNIWIIVWFFYCGLSILWSDFPIVSMKRLIKELGLFLSILVVLTEKDPITSVITLIKKFSYILVPISICLILYFPLLGMSYSIDTGFVTYAGVAHNKNGLGAICLVSSFIFLYSIISTKKINSISIFNKQTIVYLVYCIISITLLIKVKSSTPLGALIIGIMIFILMRIKIIKENVKILGIALLCGLVTLIILQVTFNLEELFLSSLGREATLTGRTLLWKDLLSMKINPLIGAGYGNFWLGERLAIIWETQPWRPLQSHNGYLNVYLELGAIGFSLMMTILYVSYKKIKNMLKINFNYGLFQFVILIFTLLYNITEDSFGNISLIWFVYLLVFVDNSQTSKINYSK